MPKKSYKLLIMGNNLHILIQETSLFDVGNMGNHEKTKKAKLAFDERDREMSIINDKNELNSYSGGNNPPSTTCVLNVFEHLSGELIVTIC